MTTVYLVGLVLVAVFLVLFDRSKKERWSHQNRLRLWLSAMVLYGGWLVALSWTAYRTAAAL